MLKSLQRLTVISRHFAPIVGLRNCLSASNQPCTPSMTITPAQCLVDEKIEIKLCGLPSNQLVTLVVNVIENGYEFESRCLYEADSNGEIYSSSSKSLAGSYEGRLS